MHILVPNQFSYLQLITWFWNQVCRSWGSLGLFFLPVPCWPANKSQVPDSRQVWMNSNRWSVEFPWERKAGFFLLCFIKCIIAKHPFIFIRHNVTVLKGLLYWCVWIVFLKRNRLDPWLSFPDCQLLVWGGLLYGMTLFFWKILLTVSKELSKPEKREGSLSMFSEKAWKCCLFFTLI